MLLRQCEAFRLFINANPVATEALTDAKTEFAYSASILVLSDREGPQHVANLRHTASHFWPVEAVPTAFDHGRINSFRRVIQSFLSGFRPSWICGIRYFKNMKRVGSKPVFYSFIGRNQDLVVRELARRNKFHIVCNWLGIPGLTHFGAITCLPCSYQMSKHCANVSRHSQFF